MKRKTIVVISTLVILGLLLGVFGCTQAVITPSPTPSPSPTGTLSPTPSPKPSPSPSPSPTQPQVIKWRGQSNNTFAPAIARFPGYYNLAPASGTSGYFYAEWIKQRTGGRLIIDVAAPGGIVPVADMMTAVEKGTLDIAAEGYGGFHTGIIPEADIETGLPFAWSNPEEAWDALYHWGLKAELDAVYAEHNIWPFVWGMGDLYHFGTTFEVSTPDAIKGKKIRAPGVYGKYVQALGGSPVTIPGGEIYMAAKLGTVDGFIGGSVYLEQYKLKEVCKYYVVEPNPNTIGASFYFNKKSLDALPADIKDIIMTDTRYVIQGLSMGYYIREHQLVNQTAAEGYTKPVKWSAEDIARVTKIGISLWDEVAAKSARCKKLVDIVKAQMKDLGKM